MAEIDNHGNCSLCGGIHWGSSHCPYTPEQRQRMDDEAQALKLGTAHGDESPVTIEGVRTEISEMFPLGPAGDGSMAATAESFVKFANGLPWLRSGRIADFAVSEEEACRITLINFRRYIFDCSIAPMWPGYRLFWRSPPEVQSSEAGYWVRMRLLVSNLPDFKLSDKLALLVLQKRQADMTPVERDSIAKWLRIVVYNMERQEYDDGLMQACVEMER